MFYHTPLRRQRGGVLITTLAITLVISFILAGVGVFTVSHYSRATSEASYANALNLAEAGVNYELRKISQNAANADQPGASNPPGTVYNFGGGTFRVYCTNLSGGTWNPATDQKLYINASGTYGGVSRAVQIRAKSIPATTTQYTMFAQQSLTEAGGGTISGNIGTNNTISFTGATTDTGSFLFNGPGAGWSGAAPTGVTSVYNSQPVVWPTVDTIALQQFPNSGATAPGGLSYLANNNNNANANPPIVGNTLNYTGSFSMTLPPGNYYLSSVNCSGTATITMDNANGPVTLWIGPSDGTTQALFSNTTSFLSTSTNPANPCTIYVGTQGGISFAGQTTLQGSLYAYNKDANSLPIGSITKTGTATLSASGIVLAPTINITGGATLAYTPGSPQVPLTTAYYSFDKYWTEIGGM